MSARKHDLSIAKHRRRRARYGSLVHLCQLCAHAFACRAELMLG